MLHENFIGDIPQRLGLRDVGLAKFFGQYIGARDAATFKIKDVM